MNKHTILKRGIFIMVQVELLIVSSGLCPSCMLNSGSLLLNETRFSLSGMCEDETVTEDQLTYPHERGISFLPPPLFIPPQWCSCSSVHDLSLNFFERFPQPRSIPWRSLAVAFVPTWVTINRYFPEVYFLFKYDFLFERSRDEVSLSQWMCST